MTGAQLQHLLGNSQLGFSRLDADLRFVEVAPPFAPGPCPPGLRRAATEVAAGSGPVRNMAFADEAGRRWLLELIKFPDALGGGVGVVATPASERDEAHTIHAHEQLAITRERLQFALEAGELGTFHCPFPLGTIEWNDRCKEHFFLPPDAQVDFDLFYRLIHPEDRERVRVAVNQSTAELTGYDIQYRTVGPGGQSRWIRAKGRTFFDAHGKPQRFDGITLDVTAEMQLMAERQALLLAEQSARLQAERASRLKDEFLATLSHELRTPLASVLGWVQMLQHQPELQVEGLQTIERNARAQLNLIEDLLDVSRIVTGKLRLHPGPCTLQDILQAAAATVATMAAGRQITLRLRLPERPVELHADAARLQQVVWNLLSNSIKFTPEGGQVDLTLEADERRALISVTDTGPGIAPELLPHVFDRFRQLDSSTTRHHGGLGLGLSLVRQLVELHGGLVSVHNRDSGSNGEAGGAVFTVSLPVRNGAAASPDSHTFDFPLDAALRPELIAGLTVVSVDDDADLRDLMQRLLSSYGVMVYSAESAAEALELVQRQRPDLLISDIGMPQLDGYRMMEMIRALPPDQGGTTPAVALTAFARPEDHQRALQAGFQAHLSKPVEIATLCQTLAELAGRRRTAFKQS